MSQRKTSRIGQAGAATALENAYNDYAGAFKHMNILGLLQPLGAANTATNFLPGSTIAFFNTDTALHYAKLGEGSVTAPTDASNGIPLPPGEYTILGTGDNDFYQCDDATVFAYLVVDDSLRSGN